MALWCRRFIYRRISRSQSHGRPRQYDYTRSGNPTRDQLAGALADLEGGAGAVVTCTGMAAITLVLATLPNGARIIAPHDCYGGTYRLLAALHAKGNLVVDFVDQGNPHALQNSLTAGAELVWIETPSNPLLRVVDIRAISRGCPRRRCRGRSGQYLSIAGLAATLESRRRFGAALHHQVLEWPQRRGRRSGDCRHR